MRHQRFRLRSSFRYSPDVLDERLFHSRSPPRLFNAAALGGLKPAPAGRLREAFLPSSAQFHREYSVFVAHINLSPLRSTDKRTEHCPKCHQGQLQAVYLIDPKPLLTGG